MRKRSWIEPSLYKKILAAVPVPCVDAVIVNRNRFLLGKRINKPAKGQWWFIGGRIFKEELLQQAVARHIKEETGIAKIRIKRFLTTKETIFKNSAQGPRSHTVNSVFLVEVPYKNYLPPKNSENLQLKWFSKINKRWPAYVRKVLKLAGFK